MKIKKIRIEKKKSFRENKRNRERKREMKKEEAVEGRSYRSTG